MIKKLLVIGFVGLLFAFALNFDSAEAKKSSKSGIAQADLDSMSNTVDGLTKKMYGNGLFSPEDNENLINIKLKLDNQMLVASDPSLAPLYYKVGVLLKSREMKDDAVDCFQTILENFADTALAPKAAAQLKLMGVSVQLPQKPGASTSGGE
jgi:hypothetical protein